MTKPDVHGRVSVKRCPECGVEFKAGIKYCDFCGRKVEVQTVASSADKQASGSAAGMLKVLVIGCIAIGILVYAGGQLKKPAPPPAPPPSTIDGKRQAAAACEAALRQQARGPFRVIALRSTLVALEQAGYAVTGSVELQSAAGELKLQRYFCKVQPDAQGGMVVDEGKVY